MSESLRHSFTERRDGRDRAIGPSDAPFRSAFAQEEDDSSQIYPCTAGISPQLVLPLASVAGLVVPGVEAELEDGGFDIVPFVFLLLGDVFHQLPRTHRLQLLGQEVPLLVPGSVARIRDAERSASGPLGLIDLTGPRVSDSDRIAVTFIQQVAGLAALDAGEYPADRKRPIVGVLVGPVAVHRLHLRASGRFALGNGIFVESIVRSRGPLHLHARNQERRLVLHLHQTERLACEKVVVALLHQVLVRAAEPLLEDGHRHQPTDRCRRGTHVALLEQRLEHGLVNLGRDQTEELVEPGLGIFILLRRTLAHQVGGVVEQGHLGVYVGLSEHGNLLSKSYAS